MDYPTFPDPGANVLESLRRPRKAPARQRGLADLIDARGQFDNGAMADHLNERAPLGGANATSPLDIAPPGPTTPYHPLSGMAASLLMGQTGGAPARPQVADPLARPFGFDETGSSRDAPLPQASGSPLGRQNAADAAAVAGNAATLAPEDRKWSMGTKQPQLNPQIGSAAQNGSPIQDADMSRIIGQLGGMVGSAPEMEPTQYSFVGGGPTRATGFTNMTTGAHGGGAPGGTMLRFDPANAERASMYNARLGAGSQLLGEIMRNQLGQGGLALRGAEVLGTNGVPGSIQTSAQQAAAQFSPEGLRNQANQRIREALATRTDLSPEAVNESLRVLGVGRPNPNAVPNFMQPGGAGQPAVPQNSGGTSAGAVRPATAQPTQDGNNPDAELTPIQQRIREATASAMRAFPQQPGTPVGRPHEAPAPAWSAEAAPMFNRAITDYLKTFSDEELRGNYGDIMRALSTKFGGTVLDQYWRSQEPTWNWRSRGTPDETRIEQLRRLTRLRGAQTPMSSTRVGIPWWSNWTSSNGQMPGPSDVLPGSVYRTGGFPMTLE